MANKVGGYHLPSATKAVSSSWGGHRNRTPPSSEPGTDYPCAYGSSIYAPEDGIVVDTKVTTSGATGRYVTVDLDDGWRTRDLHLSQVLVKVGQRVKRGQIIAKSGASGFGKEWGYGAHVHRTLWSRQAYSFGRDATLDFEKYAGADNDGLVRNQTVADRQNWLNQSRGEKLVVDGIEGPATKDAYGRYQTFLKKSWGYTGAVDKVWGPGTQAAHQRYFDDYHKKPTNPAYHKATVRDLKGLKWVNGLQKIAMRYGYKGAMDNIWGDGSAAGLQKFLDQNYGGSLAAWLRAKWGYKDRDDLWGPNMMAAAARAEAANYKAL